MFVSVQIKTIQCLSVPPPRVLWSVTIDIEVSSLSVSAGCISGQTGVAATVSVANMGYHQHAASPTYGSRHYAQVGAELSSVKGPGDTERLVPLRHHTGELAKCSLIENIRPKTQRQDPWRL